PLRGPDATPPRAPPSSPRRPSMGTLKNGALSPRKAAASRGAVLAAQKTGGNRESVGSHLPLMSERIGRRRKPYFGFARRREILLPTWRGWLLLFCVGALLFSAFLFGIFPFLAVPDPVRGGILVVEGWGSEDAMRTVAEEFRTHHYDRLYVTGGPIEKSSPLASYNTVAELGAATLERMGLDSGEVQAVPAPEVNQDRTY